MAGPLTVGSAIIKVVADWSGAASDLDKFRKKTEGDFKRTAGKIGTAMTAGALAVGAGLVAAAKKAATFGEGMAKVATLGVTDLDKLKQGVFDLATAYGVDLIDATDALYQAISSPVLDENSAIMVLEKAAIGAQAGVSSLGEALDLGTSVMAAYNLKADDAATTTANFEKIMGLAATAVKNGKTTIAEMAQSIGQLGPVASNAGVPVEELFAGISALTASGLGASEAMTQMRAMITGIIAPTPAAIEAAEEMGIQFDATALQSKGLSGVLDDVKQATGGNIEQMSRLFGSVEAMGAALSLTGAQGDAFASSLADMANAQANLNEMAKAFQINNPALEWKRLKGELQVLAVVLGDAVLPAFREMLKVIKPAIAALGDFAREHPKIAAGLGSMAVAITGVSLVLGPFIKLWSMWKIASIAGNVGMLTKSLGGAKVALGGLGAAAGASAGTIALFVGVVGSAIAAVGFMGTTMVKARQRFAEINQEMDGHRSLLTKHIGMLEELTGKLDTSAMATLNLAEQQDVLYAMTEALADYQMTSGVQSQEMHYQVVMAAQRAKVAEIQSIQERISWYDRLISVVRGYLEWISGATIAGWFTGGPDVSGAPGMATGGLVAEGGMVQLHRDELVLLPPAAEVIPRGHTEAVASAMKGGGATYNIAPQVHIHNPLLLEEQNLQKLRDELGKLTGRSVTRALSAKGLA